MKTKLYSSIVDFRTSCGTKQIKFSRSYTLNGILRKGYYETSDPNEQKAIESDYFFGTKIFLERVTEIPDATESQNNISEESKFDEPAKEVSKSEFIVEEVTTEEEAANYFIEHFNVEESEVSSITKIRNRMKKYGVEFPNLKK